MTESVARKSDAEIIRSVLEDAAVSIRALESQGEKALHEGNDPDAFAQAMRQKCEILLSLPEKIADAAAQLDGEAAGAALKGAAGMAGRARSALDVDSTFFMRHLLYPEEYREGEPNELERLAASLQNTPT